MTNQLILDRILNLRRFISLEKSANRLSVIISATVMGIGVGATWLAYILAEVNTLIVSLGACISLVFSAYPWKEYVSRKHKIIICEGLIGKYNRLLNNPNLFEIYNKPHSSNGKSEFERMEEIYWEILKKTSGG